MKKHPAFGPKPAARTRKQCLPVGHVFEHLDRNDPVKAGAGVEHVHVGCHDRHIIEACRCGLCFNVSPLRS